MCVQYYLRVETASKWYGQRRHRGNADLGTGAGAAACGNVAKRLSWTRCPAPVLAEPGNVPEPAALDAAVELVTSAEELAAADQRMALAEGRLVRQVEIISRLTTLGHDTSLAEQLLQQMRLALGLMRERRRLLLRGIIRADGRRKPYAGASGGFATSPPRARIGSGRPMQPTGSSGCRPTSRDAPVVATKLKCPRACKAEVSA